MNIIRRVLNKILQKKHIDHSQLMLGGLTRSKNLGINPATIVDLGAAKGAWSVEALNFWPASDFVLFEPLAEREAVLKDLSSTNNKFHIVAKAAGKNVENITFHVTEDLDGSGIAANGSNTEQRTINVTTVDLEIKRLNLKGPYLLKLDTHGYEVPIFEGATEVLKETQLIIVECYGFPIAPNSLLFWETCEYLDKKGFRLSDIVEVVHRPKDNCFWQCDAFFIPKDHPVLKFNTYNY
jgi:FkbM family methyltransferase